MALHKQLPDSPEIYNLLNQAPLLTLNIQGILENTPASELEVWTDSLTSPTGVLVRKDYFHYIYTESEGFLDHLLEAYFKEDSYGFSGLSNFVANYLGPHFTWQWDSPCDLYYLPENGLVTSLKKRITKKIPKEYAEEINHYYTYKDEHSLSYILYCLEHLPSSGYFDGQTLCSWVLVHDDNSLGIMYTKEAYRGKGYAVDVTIDLCEQQLKRGKTPFVQINTANTMSPGLAKKCGFMPYTTNAGSSPQEHKGEAIWFGGNKKKLSLAE